eukprot:COSAG01_NODE_22599_length_849_cov_0.918667_1_plen_105_part_10
MSSGGCGWAQGLWLGTGLAVVAAALVGVGGVEGEPEGGHVGGRQAEVALVRVQKLLPLVASERCEAGPCEDGGQLLRHEPWAQGGGRARLVPACLPVCVPACARA